MVSQHDDTLLIFRIDRIACAVPADSVQAIVLPPEHLTHPPGSDRGRPGIFRHQEHVYAVVDLHQRFGLDCPRRGNGRLLLYENGPRRHALWVDKVEELLRSEAGTYTTLPRYLPRELFHSGFLYRNEIVLCTTLDALLAMRDAAPIQCHLEQLREQEQERKREQPASSAPPESPKPVMPEIKARPRVEKKAPLPVAPAAKRAAAAPVPPPKPRQARPAPAPITARKITPPATRVERPAAVPQRDAPPQPEVHTHSVNISDNGNDSRLPLLLLLLLTLGGIATGLYLLWPEPAKVRPLPVYTPPPPRPLPTPLAQAVAPPLVPVSEQPVEMPEAVVVEAETPEPESPPPAEEAVDDKIEEKVEEPVIEAEAPPALQVEKDAEGMITLIIERKQLLKLERAIAPTKEVMVPAAREGTTPTAEKAIAPPVEEVEEEPLVPDADWPKPAPQIEPCDCIHIVVKGDTLWDIAKRYTHNALNYPVLARRSGIRDPHWIYPGDRVHLIIR